MEIVKPPAPGNIRKAIVAKRRLEVARLMGRGLSSSAIAAELREKVATVQADRRANLKLWKREVVGLEDDHRARIVHECGLIKTEAWGAWDRSKAEQRKTTQKAAPAKPSKTPGAPDLGAGQMRPFEVTLERKDSPGDPRFLERLISVAALEAKLLGLMAEEGGEKTPPAPVNVKVLVVNDAGLSPDMPWLSNIPAGRAEQGQPLLPPGEAEDG